MEDSEKAAVLKVLTARTREIMTTGESARGTCAGEAGATAREGGNEAYAKILRLSALRERSSEGLRRRLLQDGFAEGEVERALARAQRLGVVDDGRYAESLYRSRLAAGRGLQGIRAELKDLGIDTNIAGGLDDADGGEAETLRALSLLRKRPPKAKNKRDAAYRKLVQKGYGASVAATASRLWAEELEA